MRGALRFFAGIAVCAVTAVALTFLLRDGGTIRLAAPALSLQVVIVTALCWGRMPALIGAIIAGIAFALWLYPPYGSIWVHDPFERVVLTVFQLAALCVTRLSPRAMSPHALRIR